MNRLQVPGALAALLASLMIDVQVTPARGEEASARPASAAPAEKPDVLREKHELLEWTLSPNGRYGLIVIDPELEVDHARCFLVTVKPRRVLATLEKSDLPAEDKVYLKTTWSKDSRIVLVNCGHANNAIDVQLLELRDDVVIRQTDLLAPVNEMLEASFRKSGAPASSSSRNFYGLGLPEEWILDAKASRVKVRVYAQSGEDADHAAWSRTFRGVWSIPEKKWLTQKLTQEMPPSGE
jgi:hypothetical protein